VDSPFISNEESHPRRIGWLDGVPRDQQALLQFPGVEILQSESQRMVLRIPPSPARPTLIAKIHQERDLAARCRRFLGWGRARLEWHNLTLAEAGGAAVPRPVALACHRDHDIVFFDYLLDTEHFPQFLERFDGVERVAMLRVLGNWLAGIVRAGVDAHDIHTGNILVRGADAETASLWLIDLHDAKVGFGVAPHRRVAMVRQIARALGAARAGKDVLHFLQGWAHGARARGIDGSWAVGPDRETTGVGWADVVEDRHDETLHAAERAEIRRRRRHISRALRGGKGTHHQRVKVEGEVQVRRRSPAVSSHPGYSVGEPRAAWFGDRVLQTVWHDKPRSALFIEEASGVSERVVEPVVAGTTLATLLRDPATVADRVQLAIIIDTVIETMARYHHEGIQLEGATPEQWFIEKSRGGYQAQPDLACIRYRGTLTAGTRLADLLQLGAIFDGTVTPTDRLRVLRSHPEFASLSHHRSALRSLATHLGDLFATSTPSELPIRVQPVADLQQACSRLHLLNQEHVPELGGLDEESFESLLRNASMVRMVEGESADSAVALMVVMLPDDRYDSPNFLWFRRHFDDFAYVDRIATAASARRRGIGSALYAVLEAWARNRGLSSIVCEVNLQPRNQGSIDFHHACGFREVGQYIGRGKPVMMMRKLLLS